MFPFHISSSYFESENLIQQNSSAAGSASTYSDSDSTVSTTSSSDSVSSIPKISTFFDPLTCQRQNYSFPEKIVYYLAKNVTNAKTYQKLVESCKYFYKVNPMIVVSSLFCYGRTWCAFYEEEEKHHVELKYDQPINYKIWVTEKFGWFNGDASKVIPLIYKNDATVVVLHTEPLKFEEFLFLAGNAKELSMWCQLIQYANGDTVQLEDIVKNLPELKKLDYVPCFDGSDVNSNTVKKLLEIEHFKNISHLSLRNVSEALNVDGMFKLITENKQIKVELYYRGEISDACKERVREYANRLKNEEGCNSKIRFDGMGLLE